MNNTNRGFLLVLILAVISVVIIGGVFYVRRGAVVPVVTEVTPPKQTQSQSTYIPKASSFATKTVPTKTAALTPTPITNQTSTLASPNDSDRGSDIYVIHDDGTLILPSGQTNHKAAVKKFYELNPDKKDVYDFVSLFTTFKDPFGIEYHYPFQNNVTGIGLGAVYPAEKGFPSKLLGLNYIANSLNPTNITSREELNKSFFLLDHETGHQWATYTNAFEGLTDGVHYTKWVSNSFQRDGKLWGDAMGGWLWRQNSDGTFSVTAAERTGFSNLTLYLMGMKPLSEVSDIQMLAPQNPKDDGLNNVNGSMKTIKVSDFISKYGPRVPSYTESQKDFRMAYVLLTKRGDTQYEPFVEVLRWVALDFPKEWNLITYGVSTINK